MSHEALAVARLRELLDYDPATGVFVWRVSRGRGVKPGDPAGGKNGCGYVLIGLDGARWHAHRLAWLYVYGAWPVQQIDHINGDRADNRIANLRDVSPTLNGQNQKRAQRGNRTGLLGVVKVKDRFRAQISVPTGPVVLGTYATATEAHTVYVIAKRALHPGGTL